MLRSTTGVKRSGFAVMRFDILLFQPIGADSYLHRCHQAPEVDLDTIFAKRSGSGAMRLEILLFQSTGADSYFRRYLQIREVKADATFDQGGQKFGFVKKFFTIGF